MNFAASASSDYLISILKFPSLIGTLTAILDPFLSLEPKEPSFASDVVLIQSLEANKFAARYTAP